MNLSTRFSRRHCGIVLGLLLGGLGIGCGGTGPKMPEMPTSFSQMNPWAEKRTARSQSPDENDSPLETTVDTPLIGDHTTIAGLNLITLQGVGLVTGLDGTGSDPPPSHYRELMLDEMRRRNIKNPNQILASPNTALVVVRAYLPPLVRKGDNFDIEVRVPGESESTSLNGGWLMETYLSEQAIVPGEGLMKGKVFAKAEGPILVSTGEGGDKESLAGVLRRGKVLGGGISLAERDLTIFLRNDFRSFRNAKRIADRIGTRYFRYNEYGLREPLAEAKTDQRIVLSIPPKYKDNYPRYLQVIRNIAFRESNIAKRVRMEKLSKELNNPYKAEKASLQLEAIGNEAIPTLKYALKNPSLEVRFHAAMALAYLEEPEGIPHLAQAAKEEAAFRIFSYAALAAVDDAESHLALRDLMNGDSAETRYGAFRSLSVLDANDPFIEGEKLNDQFTLHVLETTGTPLVHLTNRRKAEVVLFNSDQKFDTPIALRAGEHILITGSPGSETIAVSRYEVGRPDQRQEVSRNIADVIRAVSSMGASYPDVAQMLVQAEQQHNLPGSLEIDALPKAGRTYFRPDPNDPKKRGRQARIGNSGLVPNLFDGEDLKNNLPNSIDGSWDSPAPRSDSDEENEPQDRNKKIAPQDDVLKDSRKWYDPRRLLLPDEIPSMQEESKDDNMEESE
ncbi:MAG: flagellar basal body P-ring protein FlgI [Planctomycetaceae bacterium]|nr:flagellar basal body P-ring protein FlgI [Planctomycetaceae bacterium]